MAFDGAPRVRPSAKVIAFVSMLFGLGSAYSADLAAEQTALEIIANFADRLCTKIPLGGSGDDLELSGQAKAELNDVLRQLVNLGIEGAAKYRIHEWKGPLQQDLARMVSESTQCKREVWRDLKYLLITSSSDKTEAGPEKGSTGQFEGWSLTPDWRPLNGMLVNDGTGPYGKFVPAFSSYKPISANYTVEAEILVIQGDSSSFGIVVRADHKEGYAIGVGGGWGRSTNICYLNGWWGTNDRKGCIAQGQPFAPGTDWHTYRVDTDGNRITLIIDGSVMTRVSDNKYLSAARVGLWSNGYQLEVRNFKVIER